jgi:hypothetical protein
MLVAAAMACGGGSDSRPSALSETPVTTATAEPTNSPEPTPTTGYKTSADGSITYTADNSQTLNVPQIPGLKAELKTGNAQQKVVYVATAENPYGLEIEAYAGEYKPSVYVENNQTGGVVLKAPVVLKLIDEKLATIPEQKDRWTIPLPLDLRQSNGSVEIDFGKKTVGDYSSPFIFIKLNERIPLINIIPGSQDLRIASDIYGFVGYYDSILRTYPNYKQIIPGMEMRYITVKASSIEIQPQTDVQSNFGDEVSNATGTIGVNYGTPDNQPPLTMDKVLIVGRLPVFVASNTP